MGSIKKTFKNKIVFVCRSKAVVATWCSEQDNKNAYFERMFLPSQKSFLGDDIRRDLAGYGDLLNDVMGFDSLLERIRTLLKIPNNIKIVFCLLEKDIESDWHKKIVFYCVLKRYEIYYVPYGRENLPMDSFIKEENQQVISNLINNLYKLDGQITPNKLYLEDLLIVLMFMRIVLLRKASFFQSHH